MVRENAVGGTERWDDMVDVTTFATRVKQEKAKIAADAIAHKKELEEVGTQALRLVFIVLSRGFIILHRIALDYAEENCYRADSMLQYIRFELLCCWF